MKAFFLDFRRFLDSKLDSCDLKTEEGQAQYDTLEEVIVELQQHYRFQEAWDQN